MRRTRRTDGADDLLTLKKKICEAIDENRDAFIALGHSVLREPGTAFSEFKTAGFLIESMANLHIFTIMFFKYILLFAGTFTVFKLQKNVSTLKSNAYVL